MILRIAKLVFALVSAAAFFTCAAAEAKVSKRITCVFRGESSTCKSAICTNSPRLYVGKPRYRLTLDFAAGTADLNGIQGTIVRSSSTALSKVYWDLKILGSQVISRKDNANGVIVTLASDYHQASFSCRPSNQN